MNSEFARLYAIARMGFTVVPIIMNHPEHGTCTLEMDGKGMRAKSFKDGWERYQTWEELDKPSNNSVLVSDAPPTSEA